MKFILTEHAKERMIERGIKINDIEEAIEFSDYNVKRGNKIESYKKIKDKMLKIVYVQEGKFIKIITVVWK